jgi:transposase
MDDYSLDLRKRIVDAVECGEHTKRKIAEMFNVHEAFIYKFLRQLRDRVDIAPLPLGGGAVAKLDSDHLTVLSNLVSGMPDSTLEEFREQLKIKLGLRTVSQRFGERCIFRTIVNAHSGRS